MWIHTTFVNGLLTFLWEEHTLLARRHSSFSCVSLSTCFSAHFRYVVTFAGVLWLLRVGVVASAIVLWLLCLCFFRLRACVSDIQFVWCVWATVHVGWQEQSHLFIKCSLLVQATKFLCFVLFQRETVSR